MKALVLHRVEKHNHIAHAIVLHNSDIRASPPSVHNLYMYVIIGTVIMRTCQAFGLDLALYSLDIKFPIYI